MEKIPATANELDLNVKDLNIQDLLPNNIDNVILTLDENSCIINLPKNMTGFDLKKWKCNKGGIFYKDVKLFLTNKQHGQYCLLNEENYQTIIRIIEDDEIESFNTLGLINGKIKDKAFMVLKHVNYGDSLTKIDRYIEQIEELEVPKIIMPDITSVPEDNESQINIESISLFD